MSILLRSRLDATSEDYFNELYRQYGCIPDHHQQAILLRNAYFTRYILEKNPGDFKTAIEKDWSYVARREYRYDVNVRAAVDAFAVADCACIVRMFMVKKFIIWPFVPVFAFTYLYRARSLFIFHNKKFFDMCNVGEQYELGYARNVVLRKCNELLDREDF
ncbi:UNKNOWN [Stylonychia lemnae]|uniref:Uncharacterized protein n=1 Tax=Stylonychia lemnae TaxID=5949 RepID=A0A078A5S4_STYLE|nr:UNKNOWN [Stylonychia lemnae]|eukprot:CDW77539.1 UNKNOWN [Stylonychia lemnae]